MACGYGVLDAHDGAHYEGQWVSDLPDGYGIFRDDTGHYEGMWKAGEFHGVGVHRDLHGMFVGCFVDGERDGEGVNVFGDGTVYIGSFRNDDFDGFGMFFLTIGVL